MNWILDLMAQLGEQYAIHIESNVSGMLEFSLYEKTTILFTFTGEPIGEVKRLILTKLKDDRADEICSIDEEIFSANERLKMLSEKRRNAVGKLNKLREIS